MGYLCRPIHGGDAADVQTFKVYREQMFINIVEPSMGTLEERTRICVPYPIELNLTASLAFKEYEIHVDDWKHFAYFSPESLHKPLLAEVKTQEPPDVVGILSPFTEPTPQRVANAMLDLHIQYHMVMGVSRFVQYTQVRPFLHVNFFLKTMIFCGRLQ
jgi:hypothetical protein